MVQATDFLTYCLGVSCLLLAIAGSLRLLVRERGRKQPDSTQVLQSPDPGPTGTARRLMEFQEARFASPIVRRHMEATNVPPVLTSPRRGRPPMPPPRSRKAPDKKE